MISAFATALIFAFIPAQASPIIDFDSYFAELHSIQWAYDNDSVRNDHQNQIILDPAARITRMTHELLRRDIEDGTIIFDPETLDQSIARTANDELRKKLMLEKLYQEALMRHQLSDPALLGHLQILVSKAFHALKNHSSSFTDQDLGLIRKVQAEMLARLAAGDRRLGFKVLNLEVHEVQRLNAMDLYRAHVNLSSLWFDIPYSYVGDVSDDQMKILTSVDLFAHEPSTRAVARISDAQSISEIPAYLAMVLAEHPILRAFTPNQRISTFNIWLMDSTNQISGLGEDLGRAMLVASHSKLTPNPCGQRILQLGGIKLRMRH